MKLSQDTFFILGWYYFLHMANFQYEMTKSTYHHQRFHDKVMFFFFLNPFRNSHPFVNMRRSLFSLLLLSVLFGSASANPVKALADRVRGHVNSQPLRFPNQHWVRGTYYAGLMAMYESTSDRAYLDDCMKWGKQVSWRIKEQGGGPYESGAYPLVCGQIWYGCYRANKDELMMQSTLAFLENPKVENPVSAPGEWYLENTGHRFVDGLFTAPPLLAMLYQMTEAEKYVDWMDACFWDVHKEIFDPDAGLFYRDARSKPRKTKNGKKVLWSRGNGWAFGGLTRILKHLPEHHKRYARYKALYIQMAESLAIRQQADGFWRSNLDDPEQYAMKESSGTGFSATASPGESIMGS